MNDYKKSSQVIDILDSIPENDNRVSDRLPLFCGNKGVNECKRESSGQRTEKRYNSSCNGVNLPKLQKKSTAVPPLERTISSPDPTGFLNVANIALSPRENTGDKFKREPVINCADYLIYEPACTTANLATANIDLSRYAFHSSPERIPETDGERLLSVHSKKKLQSAEVKKKEPNTPERKTRKRRETQATVFKMATTLENANPTIFLQKTEREVLPDEENEDVVDKIDEREEHLIRSINDPEHPLTLEQLNVVEQSLVEVDDANNYVKVQFTPTIPHCSMATLIGLAIRVQLLRSLPERFKVDISITPGAHASEDAVNKQLADKERVAAALENTHLLEVVNQCLTARH
ncbi:unnamed protein product [Pocillopora meandrina]|uniref:MIP18 family-like domain-containing protein n=1 Tax=Pocillopora meandrina TaxID=46732 RepID=A0AAU9VYF5_9CNID|nr:unnamed protein product [Pocillopora meandrina]